VWLRKLETSPGQPVQSGNRFPKENQNPVHLKSTPIPTVFANHVQRYKRLAGTFVEDNALFCNRLAGNILGFAAR
jgi:hypothetical protein